MIHVEIFQSVNDKYGNSYTAVRVTDDSRTIQGTVSGGAGNVRVALREIFGDWEAVRKAATIRETTLKIREFNRLVKGWGYAGCTDNLVDFMRQVV